MGSAYLKYIFILFVHLTIAKAINILMAFSRYPTFSTTTEELGCIAGSHAARGKRFNPQTQECDPLEEEWFATQIHLPGYSYFKMRIFEETFIPTTSVRMWLPNFVVGATLALDFNIGLLGQSGGMNIRFSDDPYKHNMVTMITRLDFMTNYQDPLGFNAWFNGWGDPIIIGSPFNVSNTDYKVEFEMTKTHILMRVDRSFINSFSHRTSISNYASLIVNTGNGVIFKRMQLFYPL